MPDPLESGTDTPKTIDRLTIRRTIKKTIKAPQMITRRLPFCGGVPLATQMGTIENAILTVSNHVGLPLADRAALIQCNRRLAALADPLLWGPSLDADDQAAIRAAARSGRADVVARLLKREEVDPAVGGNAPLQLAVDRGHVEVARLLLDDPRVDPTRILLVSAVEGGFDDVTLLLLEDGRIDPHGFHLAFQERMQIEERIAAVYRLGRVRTVRLLCSDDRVRHNSLVLTRDVATAGDAEMIRILWPTTPSWRHDVILEALVKHKWRDLLREVLGMRANVVQYGQASSSFLYACETNDLVSIGILMEAQRAHYWVSRDVQTRGFSIACKKRYDGVIDILLRQNDFQVSQRNEGLQVACKFGHIDLVRRMLQDKRLAPERQNSACLRYAAESGHCDVLALLIADGRSACNALNNAAVCGASENGHAGAVRMLMTDPNVDPSARKNQCIVRASRNGHGSVVAALLTDARVDPSVHANKAIRTVGSSTDEEETALLMRSLLRDARVDPTANDSEALRVGGRVSAVVADHLLMDGRADPLARNSQCLCEAAKCGQAAVVRRLLRDPRVTPVVRNQRALNIACENGHLDVVNVLLADARVVPHRNDNEALKTAALLSHGPVARRLLQVQTVTPATRRGSTPLELAMLPRADRSFDVIEILVEDPRVTFPSDLLSNVVGSMRSVNNDAAQCTQIVTRLLADPRVDPVANGLSVIYYALWGIPYQRDYVKNNGHIELIRLLVEDPRVVACANSHPSDHVDLREITNGELFQTARELVMNES